MGVHDCQWVSTTVVCRWGRDSVGVHECLMGGSRGGGRDVSLLGGWWLEINYETLINLLPRWSSVGIIVPQSE